MIATRLTVRAVRVPMRRPLATSARTIDTAPLLLIDVETNAGITGCAYVFCYDAAGQRLMADVLRDVSGLVEGAVVDPPAVRVGLARRWRLFGSAGAVDMAGAGIDVALWDALAREAGRPLVELLGGERVALRCYNSNGLGLMGERAAAAEAVELVEEGYDEIKLRLGYPTLDEDVRVVRAVRGAVGNGVSVLVDYNQLLDRDEGLRRALALDGESYWLDRRADRARRLPRRVRDRGTRRNADPDRREPARRARGAGRARCARLRSADVRSATHRRRQRLARRRTRCGIERRTALSHLFPEVSTHLLALSPAADRVEMVDWASPILREPLRVQHGTVTPSSSPGTGVSWDEEAVARYSC